MAKKRAEPSSALAAKLAELRAKDKTLRVGSLADFDMTLTPLSTANIALDNALGVGGFPRGKIIECFGLSQSGKTTSALQAAALHQKRVRTGQAEGAIMYLDYEYSLDLTYCEALGIDTNDQDTFVYQQPASLEEGCNTFRALLREGMLALAIFDSVAAMVTKKEQESDTGTSTVADRAKMLTQFLRQVKGECWRQQTAIIFLNHILEAIETGPRRPGLPPGRYTPGGRGLVFYSDVRIEFADGKKQKSEVYDAVTNVEETFETSKDVVAKVVKSKVAVPQKVARLRVRYGKGFSQAYSVYQVLVAYGVIKPSRSGWFVLPGYFVDEEEPLRIQGEEKIIRILENHSHILERALVEAETLVADHPEQDTSFDMDPNIDPTTGEVFTEDDEVPEEEQDGFDHLSRR
jgi:recombination protein RecA